jgi:hypothetical protein
MSGRSGDVERLLIFSLAAFALVLLATFIYRMIPHIRAWWPR